MIHIEIPTFTLKENFDDYKDVPAIGGIYIFYNQNGQPVYIGKCNDLKQRIYTHKIGITNTRRVSSTFISVKFFEENCPMNRDIYETYLINKLQPIFNITKCFLFKAKYVQLPIISERKQYERKTPVENRCAHVKNDGTQCKNYISENGYCGIHKRQHKKIS